MFSRVLKTTTAQPPSEPPASPAKSRSSHVKAQSTSAAPPSPSKIPVPVGASRSAFQPAKENKDAGGNGNNYLSFLFSNNASISSNNSPASGASTPVKVNKGITQSSNPAVTHGSHAHSTASQQQQHSYARVEPIRGQHDEDVHMQTMKSTVNPAMLKQLASIPQGIQQVLPVASRPAPALPARLMMHQSEDVHMRTQRNETRAGERGGLQLWERELLESAEVRRKATVAQICELCDDAGT